jgi:hypothetical protein
MSIIQILVGAIVSSESGGGGGGSAAADFTIEWWQKVENSSSNARPWSVGLYTTQILSISYESLTSDYYWINSSILGSVAQNHVGAGWRHMAFVRSGGIVRGYVNGVQYTGNYTATQLITNTTTPLYVGTGEVGSGTYKGYITNLHIIKGVAKYVTTFTPPTAPTIPSLGSVMLLRAQNDGSKYTDTVGAKTSNLTGTVAWSADTPFTATGPFTQANSSWVNTPGSYALDFSGANYNGNLLNVVQGWTVSDGSGLSGTVTADAFLASPSVIRISVDFDPVDANTWTFTQPEFGGSIYFDGNSYLNYGASTDWAMDVTVPAYTVTPEANNVNEGSSLTFNVIGLNVTDGTHYWTVSNSGDFGTSSGSFSMTSNSGSFSVTPTADTTTEGAETFTVSVRTGSTSGTVVATSKLVTINDTSIDPVPPLSLDFPVSGTPWMLVSNTQSDWNLGSTYTLEFWSKSASASTDGPRVVMSQFSGSNQIDVGYTYTHLLFNGAEPIITEPTPGVWTHVAFVADGSGLTTVYYNGVAQGVISSAGLTDGSKDLVIGRRGPDGPFQYFRGKLAMIRISSTAKYSTAFNPSFSYGVGADTKLLLGSNTPTVDSVGTHPITNNGAVISSDFPTYQSLVFNMAGFLTTPANADWNLGTTWTIEFWMKANAASDTAAGGIWGLLNQTGWNAVNSINVALSDNKLVFLSGSNANDDVRYTEPTVGAWSHVAITNDAGTQKVYYNGAEQTKVSGTFGSANYANTTDNLYIGRLSNQYTGYGGQFNGKLALVRISNAVKYAAPFTATTTYGVAADTKLFLGSVGPLVDDKYHVITNNGVTVSTDYPT